MVSLITRRRAAILAVAFLGLGLTAPSVEARFSIKKSIWGPIDVDGKSQFPIYSDLGAGIYQSVLRWDQVAPTRPSDPTDPADPAYTWPENLERAVRDARRYRIRVCFTVMGVPGWANGGLPWNWVPRRVRDFADFTAAAARHFKGVDLWLIWGEPSRQPNFMPLYVETVGKTSLTSQQARAPRYYARLLDAAYGALKAVRRSNLVIGGNTFTVGDISPYNWIRYMKLPGQRSPRMDMFGHNPFTSRRPDLSKPPPGRGPSVNYSDFSDLDTFAFVLDRHLRDPRGRRLRLFLSEFTLPTDHANHEFPFHVTRRVQARWLADALRITRRWQRIYTFGWTSLYDEDPRADGLSVNRGLIDSQGRRKPSYTAFKLG